MKRLQRLRSSAPLRDLVSEVGFGRAQLIQPLFLHEGASESHPVPGLRDNATLTHADLLAQVERDVAAGVRQFLLFPVPQAKRERGFDAQFAARAIRDIKATHGAAITLWVDTCLCSCTASGHCCVFDAQGRQDLAATWQELNALALAYARAGADGIAPSDINDGRVAQLRATLDEAGFDLTPIMS